MITPCPRCGEPKPAAEALTPSGQLLKCVVDNAVLSADGTCPKAPITEGHGSYPMTARCPFACPQCGGKLDWDGKCRRCYGTRTPDDDTTWTAPGDYYVLQDGHWVFWLAGPAPLMSRDALKALLDKLKRQLDPMIARSNAFQGEIDLARRQQADKGFT